MANNKNTMFNQDCQCYHVATNYIDFIDHINRNNNVWKQKGRELIGSFLYFSPDENSASRLAMVEADIDGNPSVKILDTSEIIVISDPADAKNLANAPTKILEYDKVRNRYTFYPFNIKYLPNIKTLGTSTLGISINSRSGNLTLKGRNIYLNNTSLKDLTDQLTEDTGFRTDAEKFLQEPAVEFKDSYYPLWSASQPQKPGTEDPGTEDESSSPGKDNINNHM